MEDIAGALSVPLITSIVFGAMALLKYSFSDNERILRLIPLFSALLGAALGVAAFYLSPLDMPANGFLSAIFVGASSGLAATGGHQIIKQFSKDKDTPTTLDKTD